MGEGTGTGAEALGSRAKLGSLPGPGSPSPCLDVPPGRWGGGVQDGWGQVRAGTNLSERSKGGGAGSRARPEEGAPGPDISQLERLGSLWEPLSRLPSLPGPLALLGEKATKDEEGQETPREGPHSSGGTARGSG